MPDKTRTFRRIGLVGQSRYAGLDQAVQALARFADARDLELRAEPSLAKFLPHAVGFEPQEIDLLVSMGGDGTLLRGARMVADAHVPVLGINFGYLGFLTSIAPEDLESALDAVMRGDYWLDVRFTLEALVQDGDGRTTEAYTALNDAVLHKGGFARVIRLALSIGPEHEEIGSYAADGIILATPTGSTAYSLSAGGPIVVPTVDCIIATPICPHTLVVRPLIVPAASELHVDVLTPTAELILTIDGQDGAHLQPGDRLVIRRGAATVPLVRLRGQTFFQTLRRKLHWALPPADAKT
ncbi:MAG: NAD(+)/NADH kinase [Longimicrobiales bacterium]